MTSDEFRALALQLPDVVESSHMHHPDFRREGRVFATLHYPDATWGMVKLSPEQQHDMVQRYPEVFRPVNGAWGKQGSTQVRLENAEPKILAPVLEMAWKTCRKPARRTASKRKAP